MKNNISYKKYITNGRKKYEMVKLERMKKLNSLLKMNNIKVKDLEKKLDNILENNLSKIQKSMEEIISQMSYLEK